jgi:subtilisin family serine protease
MIWCLQTSIDSYYRCVVFFPHELVATSRNLLLTPTIVLCVVLVSRGVEPVKLPFRFVFRPLTMLLLGLLIMGGTGYRPLLRAPRSGIGPGQVTVLLEMHMAPLALVGRSWSHEERWAYAQRADAARQQTITQIEALGGVVQQRFSTASSGMVVAISAEKLARLALLPEVRSMRSLPRYALGGRPAAPGTMSSLRLPRLPTDGSGVAIAIIDSGVDYSHRKLGGPGTLEAYHLAVCGVPDAAPGDAACDRAGLLVPPTSIGEAPLFPNSKVISGTDLLGDVWPTPDQRCAGVDGIPQVCPFGDRNPIDLVGHGTHVADIAAGLAIEGAEAGVAPGASLYIYKACNGAAQLCEPGALLQALDRALDLDGSDRGLCAIDCKAYDPADIINILVAGSYGQPEDGLSLFAEIATFYGSLVVGAAGNDGDVPYRVGSPSTANGALSVAEATTIGEGETARTYVTISTSRGPSIGGNRLKPDLSAPGGTLSAVAGSGNGVAAFSGSSSAAPVAAGVAALIVQELETRGFLDVAPGLRGELGLSLAPHVKAVLVNNADPTIYLNDRLLAPLTRQGGGLINPVNSYTRRTFAVDTTALSAFFAAGGTAEACSILPFSQIESYRVRRILPPCASATVGGDFLRAWNDQPPSISFGYQAVTRTTTLVRQITIHNYAVSPQTYALRHEFRDSSDEHPGVTLSITPTTVQIPAKGFAVATATLRLAPRHLPEWTINAGVLGNQGSNDACIEPASECASFQRFEIDGFVVIDSGRDTIRMPWHVLPRPVAAAAVRSVLPEEVVVRNRSWQRTAFVEAFALIDESPNQCDTIDSVCSDVDYRVGSQPGLHRSPVDLRYIGVRSQIVPGLNASYGLPPAPTGALDDEQIEFAISVYDLPYRATPNAPLRFTVRIDVERDGVVDFLVYNSDSGDGRNQVVVRDVRVSDGSVAEQIYGYADVQYNSQVLILPVPAGAVGLRSDQPFGFAVQAEDAYFSDQARNYATPAWAYDGLWDCSPAAVDGVCDGATHGYQTGLPYALPATNSFSVPAENGTFNLGYTLPVGGELASSGQRGLLLLYRNGLPGREAEGIVLR